MATAEKVGEPTYRLNLTENEMIALTRLFGKTNSHDGAILFPEAPDLPESYFNMSDLVFGPKGDGVQSPRLRAMCREILGPQPQTERPQAYAVQVTFSGDRFGPPKLLRSHYRAETGNIYFALGTIFRFADRESAQAMADHVYKEIPEVLRDQYTFRTVSA